MIRCAFWVAPLFAALLCPALVNGDGPEDDSKPPAPKIRTLGDLKKALRERNPDFSGEVQVQMPGPQRLAMQIRDKNLTDISPLKGLAIEALDLQETGVTDLSPLAGMPLKVLYLHRVPVEDISPLAGMPLEELILMETNVTDLSPLAKCSELSQLWLNDTPVEDISPLKGLPLVSLTLEGTQVADLTPLSEVSTLERLHIANTPVDDLTPLKGLKLWRLIFTPANIDKGIDAIREMESLRQLDAEFPPPGRQQVRTPEQFWEWYRAAQP